MSDMEPSVDQVVQSEYPDLMRTVPVKIETPVRVQPAPAAIGAHFTLIFQDATSAVPLVGRDPKRKRLLLLAITDPVWVGTNSQSVAKEQAFLVPVAGSGIEITHQEALWAKPDANAAAILCVIQEQWTN